MRTENVAVTPAPCEALIDSANINKYQNVSILPDQKQAWFLVIGLALILCVLFGTTLDSLGVFIAPITETFLTTNEQTANIPSVFMLTMTLAMPLAGWLFDRVGPRVVMTCGAVMMALGYQLASVSQDINSLTAAVALSGAGVGASTYIPSIALVMRWVELKRQGLALGVLMSGATLGGIIFPILLTHLIELYSWRIAMQFIAMLTLLVCVPILLWLARLPTQPLQSIDEHTHLEKLPGISINEAMRLPRYWLWVLLQVLMTLSTLGVFINLVPYLISIGYSPQEAAIIFAFNSGSALLGGFLFGFMSIRCGIKPILMIGTAIGSIGILMLLLASDLTYGFGAVICFTIAWGATFNLVNQLSPMLMEGVVGLRNFGTLLGIGSLIAGVGGAFSPKVVGYLVDSSGSYSIALILCAACMFGALVPIALQSSRARIDK